MSITHVVEVARTTYRQRPALTDAVDGVSGPALDDPGRGDAPSLDIDYASLSPDGDIDDPRLHLATYRPSCADDGRAEVFAEYLRGGLEEGVLGDVDDTAAEQAGGVAAALDGDATLDDDAARLLEELRALATDTAERARCSPTATQRVR